MWPCGWRQFSRLKGTASSRARVDWLLGPAVGGWQRTLEDSRVHFTWARQLVHGPALFPSQSSQATLLSCPLAHHHPVSIIVPRRATTPEVTPKNRRRTAGFGFGLTQGSAYGRGHIAYSLPSHRRHVAITLLIASELVIMPTTAGGKTVGHSIHFFSIAALPCRAEWLRAKSTENVECERDVEYPSKRCCHIGPPIPVHTISRHSPSSR